MAVIRAYKPADRQAVQHINYETAFLGSSLKGFFDNKELWATFGTSYYLEKEPQSCFVLEDQGRVVGYIFGCLDDRNEKAHNPVSLFTLLKAYITGSKNERYVTNYYLFRMKKEMPSVPKNAGHIHMNLLSAYRGKGYGKKMLQKWTAYAKAHGVKTLHGEMILWSKSTVQHLLLSQGWKEYDRKRNTFWKKQLPEEEMYCVCFAKKL